MPKKIVSMLLTLLLLINFAIPFMALADDGVTVSGGEEPLVYSIEGNDITNALQNAFNYCNENIGPEYTITVPEGRYSVHYTLLVSDNTTLDLTNVVLVDDSYTGSSNIFITKSGVAAYEGTKNFKVIGGELTYVEGYTGVSCLVRMAHANNISFIGTSFTDNNESHHIELAACKDVTFEGCKFLNMTGSLSKTSGEALQIDILDEDTHFALMPEYDGTMNKNITVNNCEFSNLLRGVGTQSSFAGMYHDNIKITNCTFNNISSTAIACTNFINSTISGNKITNCGEGINFYMMKSESTLSKMCIVEGKGSINKNCNSVITNNNISVIRTSDASVASPIYIYGANITKDKNVSFPTGNYYVSNIRVTGNIMNSADCGIRMYDVRNSTFSGNKINGKTTNSGIYVDADSNSNTIKSNTVVGFENGINIKNKSDSNAVSSNNVSSQKKNGILVQEGCKSNSLSSNTISSVKNNGILVDRAKSTAVNSNKISKPTNHGVCLLEAEITTLNKNTISSAGANGIYLDAKTTIKELSSNNISSSKTNGVSAYGLINKISSNTFKSNQWGIYFAPKAKATIYNNTYTSNKKGSCYCAGSKNSYKFSNLGKPSPSLSQKSKTVTIKWKKVSNATGYEIYRATSKSGSYSKLATVSSKTLSYKNKSLKKGKTYYYKVRAVRKMNSVTSYSPYSAIKSIKIK
ncbi:MAG: right-handed parallel beta-helix repeat-containing protein [Eubacterium sp.]|nr:right-handed parallel beta-helix repeat-containing protein [Eubacterium sp.]